jgi:hypothetical protein
MPDMQAALGREDILREELAWVLEAARGEPVVYFWPVSSAAYVFNASPGRRWMLPIDEVGGRFNSIVDADHLAAARRIEDELLKGRHRWVVADPMDMNRATPELRRLLEGSFDRFGSVWRRRSNGSLR